MPEVATDAAPAASEAVIASTVETPVEEQAAPNIDGDLRAVWDKHYPPRGEGGKFAAKEQNEPPTEAAETKDLAADQTAEKVVEQAKPAIDAPISWSAEQKAKWATLPPDVQTYIAQRDKEYHDAFSRAGAQIKEFEPFRDVIEPLKGYAKTLGVGEGQVIKNLLQAAQYLDQNPKAAIEWLARSRGIDLRGYSEQSQDPPEVAALRAELAARDERIAKIESHLTVQQRQQEEASTAELTRQIADFAKDKPHFEAVKAVMAGLLQSGAAGTLQDAYDRAIYADPTIRQSILADQQKAAEDKRKKDEAEKLAAAKKAQGVNVKSSTAHDRAVRTMDDDLRGIAQKHYGT